MIERKQTRAKLIGKLHPTEDETSDAIRKSRTPVSVAVLSERLGVVITAMNERVGKLVERGLARREKAQSAAGREQYVYRVLPLL
jgi:predicted transcriptional regulator